jgi:hypothetical protein
MCRGRYWGGLSRSAPHSVVGERRPLVEKLAELFKDFSQVHDVFLDDPLSLRFAGLFARAGLVVGWFASVLFRVRRHVSDHRTPSSVVTIAGATGRRASQ